MVEGFLQIQINPAAITDIETNNQPELHERTAVKDVAKRNPVKKAYEVNISNISSFRNAYVVAVQPMRCVKKEK